jgi:orotidine-5'-phosphate decarboxylase
MEKMGESTYNRAKKRIIFALDGCDLKAAKRWLNLLKEKVGYFKIGPELFCGVGPEIISYTKEITKAGIFLDLKFHDIPTTMLAACRMIKKYPVDFLTVYPPCLPHLFQEFQTSSLKIIGVTVLTSLHTKELLSLGIGKEFASDPLKLVLCQAQLAKQAGCAGIVCSGQEVGQVKALLGGNFITIIPAIRLHGDSHQDQKRVTTPYEAIKNGGDYIVVGRSIRCAPNPEKVVDKIIEEIDSAIS